MYYLSKFVQMSINIHRYAKKRKGGILFELIKKIIYIKKIIVPT